MYIPNELKLIIYDLCDDIYTKILLNKIFKWSFYERNPFQNVLYKKGPIKLSINCNGFDNFNTICPFCNNETILKLYPGNIGNPMLSCENCNSKSILEDFGNNRYSNTTTHFYSDLLLIEAILINECHCESNCLCETISIIPTFNISTLNLEYNTELYFKARNINTAGYLTVFWLEYLFA